MKNPFLLLTAFIICSLSILVSCSKDEVAKTPVVTIVSDAVVTSNTAILSATFDDQGSAVNTGGFYWSRKPNPTANDSVINGVVLNNLMSASLEELPQGETFYYTAFATSAEGTGVSAPKSFTLAQNMPQIKLLVDGTEIDNQLTMQKDISYNFIVKCSMMLPNESTSLSHIKISYNSYGTTTPITDQIIAGTATEYETNMTFSSTGVVDMVFELFDEYDNVTTKTVTVTII